MIQSPYDRDSRWSSKRAIAWEGYKLHVSEAAEDDMPHLVLAVHTTAATLADSDLVPDLHQGLVRRGMAPGQHFIDGGYTSVELMAGALDAGITMIGPLGLDSSWQARAGQGYDHASFTVDFDARQALCPQGKTSTVWSAPESLAGRVLLRFAKRDCNPCPAKALCTTAKAGRSLMIQARDQHELQARLRAEQQTDTWAELYNIRAGVEGCISRAVRGHGARRARYRGHTRTHVQHVLTACAMNAAIAADWHARGNAPAQRRSRTPFQILAAKNLTTTS
jgi:hypothetical protein